MVERRRTTTSNFGVGRRESHDSSGFYRRFTSPELRDDDVVAAPRTISQPAIHGDARTMDEIDDASVALVVTSPPYFAGKAYEEELQRDGVPGSYLEYLDLLRAVFAECKRKLEPGGRIAVNVANLGRKPYRSLAADVIRILQDDLGLLLRAELVWRKGEGASGSCAWGSFRSAANPVLRDVTERVVVASKGRFDRARTVKQRRAEGLPHESTVMTDDFLSLTLDLWSVPAESARRVGHPAPFPVELPAQLIRLYTFVDDLVLDPFMGSGSALVAAAQLQRRFAGYDLDAEYVSLARLRVDQALLERRQRDEAADRPGREPGIRAQAERLGQPAKKLAEQALAAAGFTITDRDRRIANSGVTVDFCGRDAAGVTWYFNVAGPFTSYRGGMLRSEVVWRALGQASALRGRVGDHDPVVLLTTHLPARSSEADSALRSAGVATFFDAIDVLSEDGTDRLARYCKGGHSDQPLAGFWTAADLAGRESRAPRPAQ